ncbi:MAG: hypothetical protein LC790_13725 [Actinobacteria bacterium]|nr:hypothetical protein [Actinomycetota bacterium]MCA1699894.1 hypothetical protein [Actinomycetota bacterium]
MAANAKGFPGAAAGTFLGGTTFLALGVAGLSGLIAPIAAHLPAAVPIWTALAPLPLAALSLDGTLSRVDGALLLAWFALALGGLAHAGRALAHEPPQRRRRPILLRLAGGLALLSAGGELLGEGIRKTVTSIGISQTLLGNTVIAASVEAEEVARVAVPARRKRGDIAIANLAGTIVHFTAFNAGVIALVKPLELDHESTALHLPITVGAVLLFAALLATRHRIGRREGAIMLGGYLAYLAAAIAAAT